MTDGNTYVINKYLNEREDWDALQEVTAELEQAEARIEELEDRLAKAEQMLEREIRRVRKIQLDLPPPHTVTLSSVQSEYELMLKELKGETK